MTIITDETGERDAPLPCAEALCREDAHPESSPHELDRIERELPRDRGSYSMRVRRWPDDEWTVDVFTDEFYGTSCDVTQFVSDLERMREACERANAPQLARSK